MRNIARLVNLPFDGKIHEKFFATSPPEGERIKDN